MEALTSKYTVNIVFVPSGAMLALVQSFTLVFLAVRFADMLAIANYPFVAANLDFSMAQVSPTAAPIVIAPDAGPCEDAAGAVTKSCYIKLDKDVIVGIIGRAPADFFNVIADPPVTIPGIDFVGGRDPGTNQPLVSAVGQVLEQVDLLEEQGANVIILLDHAQDFTADPLSAESLRGIDIIVAAGSTGFVGQPVPFGPYNLLREGDSADALYPIVRTDMDGNPLLVVNSDQLFLYMGHLIVDFDKDGNIVTWDGRSGPIATTEEAVDLLTGILGENYVSDGRKLGKGKGGKGKGSQAEMTLSVRQLLDDLLATPSIQQSFNSVGTTTETLNGLRVDVRTRETNLGRLAADSSIWAAQAFLDANGIAETVDMALKNGGGIRDTIFGPEITELLVESALAFDNKLAIVELTAEELLATIENSFSRVPAADGRFPQLSGLSVTFDPSNPGLEGQVSTSGPSRVVEMAQVDSTGTVVDTIVTGGVLQGDFTRTFVMATNSFLTTGGDGYASLAAAPTIATTTLGEQQILKDYIAMELGGSVSIVDPPIPANVINAIA